MTIRKKGLYTVGASMLAVALLSGCANGSTDEPAPPAPSETGAAPDNACTAVLNNEKVTLTVSTPIEGFAPLLIAMESGAFEAAGIDFSLERISAADSLAQIGQGRLDGQLTSYSFGNINAVAADVDMKWVAPFYELPPTSVTTELPGYWAHVDYVGTGPEPDLTGLEGQIVSSPTGGSGAGGWLLDKALEKQGLGVEDITFATASGVDALIGLENQAVAGAWVSAPHHMTAAANPDLRLAATYEPGLNGSGIIVGPSLLERPVVLTKMLQVIAEMNAQYLQGDYHQNDEVVGWLSNALGQEAQSIKDGLVLIFDQTLDMTDAGDYVQGLQDFGRATDSLTFAENIATDRLVDGSYATAAAACLG